MVNPATALGQIPRHIQGMTIRTKLAATVSSLCLILFLVVIFSATRGPVNIPFWDAMSILLADIGLDVGTDYTRRAELVVDQIRLPRIITAGLVGMALGTAGAALQGLFRNPMADPGIIGVSAGGALGGVIVIVTGAATAHILVTPAAALTGAFLAAFFVYGIGSIGGRFTLGVLILAGVALSSFLSAMITFILVNNSDPDAVREVLFWLSGGLDSRLWLHVRIIIGPILGGVLLIYAFARALNLMLLGEESAQSLGVQVHRIRLILLAAASIITGVAVSVSGIIAFVGLVVPHMMRLIVGPDHRVLIPVSALGGAIFLILADTIARVIISPAELRVGVITSFVGAPFFIFLLINNRRRADLL
ncbi:MAG: iron chelate uptake ABC transporter family permease subunit [Chloroflexi bacterium]|nr:iron chelate uptake ABC transporter family permease subunit [Chloroflexota bacterium]